MFKYRAILGLALISLGTIGCGSAPQTSSRTDTFVSKNGKLDAYIYIYSKLEGSGDGRCWYKAMSGERLNESQVEFAPATLLTPESIENIQVASALERSSRESMAPLVVSGSGAAGSCAGAIAGVITTATTLLTPGAQPLSAFAAVTTATSVIGCGAAGKSVIDGLWNAYYYSNLQGNLGLADVNNGMSSQDTSASDILVAALDNAKFHTTGNKCAE